MAKRKSLGLDELMIVNPSGSDSGAYFLGEDGTLYQVRGLDLGEAAAPARSFFLGEDGVVYQVQGLGEVGKPDNSRLFLGADGNLYGVFRS